MNRYIIFFYFHYYFYLNTGNFYIMRWSEYNYNFQTAWATWHSVTSIIWVDWYRPPRLHVPDRRPWHSDEIHVRCVNCEVESNVRERVVPPISCWFHCVCPNCTGVLLVTLSSHFADACIWIESTRTTHVDTRLHLLLLSGQDPMKLFFWNSRAQTPAAIQ
jgi:hypothetical protein